MARTDFSRTIITSTIKLAAVKVVDGKSAETERQGSSK